ncbi:MAG: N-acetylglucosamine-6-phosphate deacetylase [Rhodospirillales bacterium]|nr:N-acetylglucosamine-6-phosphate deacetylase [Rhodospirillales bacterium]
MPLIALSGAQVFDGERMREGDAVLMRHGQVVDIVAASAVPPQAAVEALAGGVLAPGFVDLQVNGGGGVMLGETPDTATNRATLERIATALRPLGTTALLPTLITADAATMAAVIAAAAGGPLPGVLGLHLEGPHLAPSRKGAHRAALMRPMTPADADALVAARARLGVLMVTLAVEQVAPALIRRLTDAGVIVSIGHSDASYDAARAAFDAGALCVTHLFNAMSPLTSRAPGLVGAALACGAAWGGVIADGHHVHPASLRIALAAKQGPGRLFLVSDAMATAGSAIGGFDLAGVRVHRAAGRLTLADGTLAGADIDLAGSLRVLVHAVGVPLAEALRMATTYPAALIGDATRGRLAPGRRADIVLLGDDLTVRRVWMAGQAVPAG